MIIGCMSIRGRKTAMIKDRLWNVVLCLAAVVFLSMGVSKVLYGWSSVFSYRAFWILSESMEPVIHENQLVIGRLIEEGEDLKIGEIYAYQREGIFGKEMVIHKLVGITEQGTYIFKGDNNELPDAAVDREQIGYRIFWYGK